MRRNCSSQLTDWASRWLVGSSSRRMSGLSSTSLVRATRRRSPPLRFSTRASAGGQRRASIARSIWRSSSHPLAASMAFCSLSIRAISFSVLAPSSASARETSSNSLSMPLISFSAGSMFSMTVAPESSCGSCSRWRTRMPGDRTRSPSKLVSSPARMRITVLFPAPLAPRTPILAPRYMPRPTFLSICLPLGATFDTRSNDRMIFRVSCS
mmetsp:Transcript_6359/g.17785  ORF Transcript_6359/g.17785 Transcript_6359/m.17785 type:complete len:211 (-) Transcript_6359:453-1085(-)